jgi:hypothetical protein
MRDPPWIIMRVKTPALESYGLALPRLASISRVRCLPLPSCVASIFLHNRSLLAVRQKPSGGSDGSYGLLRSVFLCADINRSLTGCQRVRRCGQFIRDIEDKV